MSYTTEADEDFFAAIGRLAISWAEIEFGIDLMLFMAYHELGGDEIEKEKPWSLERKLKFLRKCFSKIQALGSVKEIGLAILDEIKESSVTRHDMIHGIAIERIEGTGKATMVRLLRGEKPNSHKRFSVDTVHILTAAVAASKLAGRAMGLGNLLMQARQELLTQINQANGELPN